MSQCKRRVSLETADFVPQLALITQLMMGMHSAPRRRLSNTRTSGHTSQTQLTCHPRHLSVLQASHSGYDCGATLSHFICSAVAISPELAKWPKRLTSGELRIGPRRHKLICDEDGILRQEFPNVV